MDTYQCVVEDGIVVLPKQAKMKDGTNVLVMPQVDLENEWLTIPQAANKFGVSVDLIQQWIKSAKVRVHPLDFKLVNAGDVEDAVEQHELFSLTMQVVEREEKE